MVPAVLGHFHGISHVGGKATQRIIKARFVWFRMSSDCLAFVRSCQQCQPSKVTKHIQTPFARRPLPDDRFLSLHLDLVGPLPESEGQTYLLTIIDRYSRWLEAIPLSSTTAADCAQALFRHWISRFGTPQDITTDQGPQFTSALWAELLSLLGVKALRTTSYHPQCNGMIERVHRVLKERLMSKSACAADWMSNLPMVLLGLRASERDGAAVSPAHLLYGSPLRLPGEFVCPTSPSSAAVGTSDFVQQLQRSLREFRPPPVEFHSAQVRHQIPSPLRDCRSVFVRVDAVKRPLTRPYIGPFEVLERSNKTYVLSRAGKPWTVSVDRLKPCFPPVVSAPDSSSDHHHSTTVPTTSAPPAAPSPPVDHLPPAACLPQPANPSSRQDERLSRFGLRICPPRRLDL